MKEFVIMEDFPKSEIEFDQRFLDPSACYQYLFTMKWPQGFRCFKCNHQHYWVSKKHIYICQRCQHNHSLTAGTIMDSSKKPITYWFKAMWWFTTRKSGINAVNLKELLGLGSYTTAWTWLQKLRRCTIRKDREKLSGNVEIDEFFIGGQKSGKRGRGSTGKTIVVAAVERNGEKLGRIRLKVIPSCSSASLVTFINDTVEAGSTVYTDGWKGYYGLDGTHYQVFQNRASSKDSVLPGVHLIASLVKRMIIGTHHGRFDPHYLQHYLDEYVFRFNRRNSKSIGKKFMRIVQQVVSSTKITFSHLINGANSSFEYSLGLSG
jgi:transposase-like protein